MLCNSDDRFRHGEGLGDVLAAFARTGRMKDVISEAMRFRQQHGQPFRDSGLGGSTLGWIIKMAEAGTLEGTFELFAYAQAARNDLPVKYLESHIDSPGSALAAAAGFVELRRAMDE